MESNNPHVNSAANYKAMLLAAKDNRTKKQFKERIDYHIKEAAKWEALHQKQRVQDESG